MSLVTKNIRDFGVRKLATLGIEVQRPDAFLRDLFGLDDSGFAAAFAALRGTLRCSQSKMVHRNVDMPTPGLKGSLAAGVLADVGASVCCVGPLVLLTLGIGGAGVANLTALEPLRPWLIAATLVFLGWALRRLYLGPQVCEPGTVRAQPWCNGSNG